MTEESQKASGEQTDQSSNGQDIKEFVGQHALFISGLLIAGGVVVSLTMAIKKVTKTALWLVPVVMYFAGAALAIKPLQERRARIQDTEEEIVTMLGKLDPVARAQVAKHVVEAELDKV